LTVAQAIAKLQTYGAKNAALEAENKELKLKIEQLTNQSINSS